jgi:hypothetical protein
VSLGIAGIDLDGALEAEHRFAPEIHLRHLHAEVVLRRRSRQIGVRTADRQQQGGENSPEAKRPFHHRSPSARGRRCNPDFTGDGCEITIVAAASHTHRSLPRHQHAHA